MRVAIWNRYTDTVIISGSYESVKDCLEKNKGSSLEGACLAGACLEGAGLAGVNLKGADLNEASLRWANLERADLTGTDLARANLEDTNLIGANLEEANLEGANLKGADLAGIKGYSQSREVFTEVVRQQETDAFTEAEWSMIGQIIVHDLCWDSIEKRFASLMPHLLGTLAKKGFDEGQTYWKEHTAQE